MIINQFIANPARAALRPRDIWIFPGYPPSPLFIFLPCHKVLYVHDLFLMTRWQDLNWSAKLYMALPFRLAIRHLRYFFVNSLATGRELAPVVSPQAKIMPFRPAARNVFGLSPHKAVTSKSSNEPIIVGALGTIEPRKNFTAAANIIHVLGQRLNRPVELHIVGRPGWGEDYERLARMPHVRLHGFVPDDEVPDIIATWDAVLCSSHSEGLGLPLLELQHAGLPIIVPDQAIFHEVLGASGIFIRPGEPEEAAMRIADLIVQPGWSTHNAELARKNIERWNLLAEEDRKNALAFLSGLCRKTPRQNRPHHVPPDTMEAD